MKHSSVGRPALCGHWMPSRECALNDGLQGRIARKKSMISVLSAYIEDDDDIVI